MFGVSATAARLSARRARRRCRRRTGIFCIAPRLLLRRRRSRLPAARRRLDSRGWSRARAAATWAAAARRRAIGWRWSTATATRCWRDCWDAGSGRASRSSCCAISRRARAPRRAGAARRRSGSRAACSPHRCVSAGSPSLRAPLLPASAVRAASASCRARASDSRRARATRRARGDGAAMRHVTVAHRLATTAPILEGLVVHWRSPAALDQLIAAWRGDARFGLIVVDNSGELALESRPGLDRGATGREPRLRRRRQSRARARARAVRDAAQPRRSSAARRRRGAGARARRASGVGGLAPRLVGAGRRAAVRMAAAPAAEPGRRCCSRCSSCAARAPRAPSPPEGAAIGQPAGAALALRRSVLAELGGLDASFFPAWFEDVDLARPARAGGADAPLLAARGVRSRPRRLARSARLRRVPLDLLPQPGALPAQASRRGVGGSRRWSACRRRRSLRALLLPLRRPRRARGRGDALRGLAGLALGALTGFRAPARLKRSFARAGSRAERLRRRRTAGAAMTAPSTSASSPGTRRDDLAGCLAAVEALDASAARDADRRLRERATECRASRAASRRARACPTSVVRARAQPRLRRRHERGDPARQRALGAAAQPRRAGPRPTTSIAC